MEQRRDDDEHRDADERLVEVTKEIDDAKESIADMDEREVTPDFTPGIDADERVEPAVDEDEEAPPAE